MQLINIKARRCPTIATVFLSLCPCSLTCYSKDTAVSTDSATDTFEEPRELRVETISGRHTFLRRQCLLTFPSQFWQIFCLTFDPHGCVEQDIPFLFRRTSATFISSLSQIKTIIQGVVSGMDIALKSGKQSSEIYFSIHKSLSELWRRKSVKVSNASIPKTTSLKILLPGYFLTYLKKKNKNKHWTNFVRFIFQRLTKFCYKKYIVLQIQYATSFTFYWGTNYILNTSLRISNFLFFNFNKIAI